MVYVIPLIFMIVCSYIFDYRQREKGRLFCWVLLLIYLICVAGFRYRIGGDTIFYETFFNNVPTLDNITEITFKKSRFAPGFVLMTSALKSIVDDFMFFQFVFATIVNSIIFYFFWKNTRHIFFAALLYYFLMYLNINTEVMRESIAVSLFLMAWPFFRDGKWVFYYICVVPAIFFHVSAVFLLLLPAICVPGVRYFFIFGKRTWIIGAIVLFVGIAVGYMFFDFIKGLALAENISERAEVYSKADIGGKSILNVFGFLTKFVKFILYPMVAMYFLQEFHKGEMEGSIGAQRFEMMSVASIYVSLLSISILILNRYNNYLLFFPIVMMSDWIFTFFKYKGKKIRFQYVTWVIIFIPLFYTSFFSYYLNPVNSEGTLKTYMRYYPYADRLTKELDPNREKAITYRK